MSDNGDPLWSTGMRQVRELNKPHEVQRGFEVFEVSAQASKAFCGLKGILWTLEAYHRLWTHIIDFGGIS